MRRLLRKCWVAIGVGSNLEWLIITITTYIPIFHFLGMIEISNDLVLFSPILAIIGFILTCHFFGSGDGENECDDSEWMKSIDPHETIIIGDAAVLWADASGGNIRPGMYERRLIQSVKTREIENFRIHPVIGLASAFTGAPRLIMTRDTSILL